MAPDPATLVWYACYGSNCARDRFLVYLTGGRAKGADHDHEGARNDAPPIADDPVVFGTNICFVGHSARWNGAPAFLEHRAAPTGALGRRYLITLEQFADVHAQENRIRPGGLEFPDDILDLAPGQQRTVVDGAYGQPTLHILRKAYLGDDLGNNYHTADWRQRPLPDDLLDYAAIDAQVLLPLKGVCESRASSSWVMVAGNSLPPQCGCG